MFLQNLDIKSAVIGGVLSLAVGVGIYGVYLKTLGPAAFSQASAYELLGKCVSFTSNKALIPVQRAEIEAFLREVAEKFPGISKSDGVVATVAAAAGKKKVAVGMGAPLQMCVIDLTTSLKSASK